MFGTPIPKAAAAFKIKQIGNIARKHKHVARRRNASLHYMAKVCRTLQMQIRCVLDNHHKILVYCSFFLYFKAYNFELQAHKPQTAHHAPRKNKKELLFSEI